MEKFLYESCLLLQSGAQLKIFTNKKLNVNSKKKSLRSKIISKLKSSPLLPLKYLSIQPYKYIHTYIHLHTSPLNVQTERYIVKLYFKVVEVMGASPTITREITLDNAHIVHKAFNVQEFQPL